MRFWLVHSSEVSLHDQIVRQATLGALTGELAPGERLPSIRELARRFRIHPNTVSAAYRELQANNIVDQRRGSGVYVRDDIASSGNGIRRGCSLNALLDEAVRVAKSEGIAEDELQRRVSRRYAAPSRLLLFEPELELARIVQHEAQRAGYAGLRVCPLALAEWRAHMSHEARDFSPVVLPSKTATAREALHGADLLVLHISPVAGLLADKLPQSRDYLVGVASAWPGFVENTRELLVAAGFTGDTLLLRDARRRGWFRGLEQAATVVCDSLTATELPKSVSATVFPLIAAESLQILRERFVFETGTR